MTTRLAAAMAMACILSGCATLVDPTLDDGRTATLDEILHTCCEAPPLSEGLLRALETEAETIVPYIRSIRLRDGMLQRYPEAQARFFQAVQPLDVVFFSLGSELSGRIMGGYLNHVGIYLGSEADLRALGLWDHPAIRPLQDQIRAGAVMIDANGTEVGLIGPGKIFESDAIALFAPSGLTRAERRRHLLTLVRAIGTPFDFHFDVTSPEEIFCVELVNHVMPCVDLPEREVVGRMTALPDELAAEALLGQNSLIFRGFIYGGRDYWGVGSRRLLAQTIAQAWAPASQR